jgi:hypothetical protein
VPAPDAVRGAGSLAASARGRERLSRLAAAVRELFAPAAAAAARIRSEAQAGPTPTPPLRPAMPPWEVPLPSCPSESPPDWDLTAPADSPAPAPAAASTAPGGWDCHAGPEAAAGGAGSRWEDGLGPLDGGCDGGCMEGWLGESEGWERAGLGGAQVCFEAACLPAC